MTSKVVPSDKSSALLGTIHQGILDAATKHMQEYNWERGVRMCVDAGIEFPSDLLRRKVADALRENDVRTASCALRFLGEEITPKQLIACGKNMFQKGYSKAGFEFFAQAKAKPSRTALIACATFLINKDSQDATREAVALLKPLRARSLLLQIAARCRSNHIGDDEIKVSALAAAGARMRLRLFAREIENGQDRCRYSAAYYALSLLKDRKLLTAFAEKMLQVGVRDVAMKALLATGSSGKRRLIKVARTLLEEGRQESAMVIYKALKKNPSLRSLRRCFDRWMEKGLPMNDSAQKMIEFYQKTADVPRLLKLAQFLTSQTQNWEDAMRAYSAARQLLVS